MHRDDTDVEGATPHAVTGRHPRWKYNPVTARAARAYYGLKGRGLEKVVFVATTGRSGTMTLAGICNELDGVVAFHEPHPIMNNDVLTEVNAGRLDHADRVYRLMKGVNVRRDAVGSRYYVEANHLFIKTFADSALRDFGGRLAVIHLVRPPEEVAMSMYRIEWSEIGTPEGNNWWLDFRGDDNLIDMRSALEDGGRFGHTFSRALWYWYEVEARIRRWVAEHPGVPVARIETGQLSRAASVAKMLNTLGVEFDSEQLAQVCGVRLHEKLEEKTRPPLEADLARSMVVDFQAYLDEHGLDPRDRLPEPR